TQCGARAAVPARTSLGGLSGGARADRRHDPACARASPAICREACGISLCHDLSARRDVVGMSDATERRKSLQGCAALALLRAVIFFPFVIGSKTLLLSSWDAPSVMNNGAYDLSPVPVRIGRTPDPGAPAWVTEPWLKLMQQQFWTEHALPLWNPYSAYGTPLAAAMQPQPYFPLTLLTSLHVSPWTYNLLLVGRLLLAGVLMFLFMRLFLSALPSAAAAVTFMLTGYFTIYINMPHLSVEVVTP